MATSVREEPENPILPVEQREQDYCDNHKKQPAAAFCESCSKLICINCTIREHNSHQKVTIDEGKEEKTAQVKRSLRSLEEKITRVDANIQKSNSELTTFSRKAKDGHDSLHQQEAALRATLKENYETQLKILNEDYRRKEGVLKKEFAGKEREFMSACKTEKEKGERALKIAKRSLQDLKDAAKTCRDLRISSSLSKTLCVLKEARKIERAQPSSYIAFATQLKVSPSSFCPALDVEVVKKTSAKAKDRKEEEEEEECCICLSSGKDVVEIQKLDKCGHTFCKPCIDDWFKQKPMCPVCKIWYGIVTGNMPRGTIKVTKIPYTECPGHGKGVIQIDYNIPSGIQQKDHPTPGAHFKGTSRTAYLPDTPDGRRVLKKLETAFARRLTFTVGRSVTTGMNDCVVWNNIHHKTSLSGGAFGYPDPDYLFRVEDELKAAGIED